MQVTPCSICGEPATLEGLCNRHFILKAWSINTGIDNLGAFLFFKKVCAPAFKNFRYGIPRFHKEIVWEVLKDQAGWSFNDRKIVVAAPRGSSKTTLLSKALALYCAVFAKKKYIVLASKTGRAAEKNMRWIRNMLSKRILIDLFGDLRPEIHGKRLEVDDVEGIWSKSIIILRNGVTIESVGMGQQLRSAAEGEEANRIDLLIADDTETDENTKTPDRRESNEVWLFETVLPSLDIDTGTCIFINTLTHTESILAKLLDETNTGWRKRLYKIEWKSDTGERVFLWPEKFPPHIIDAIRQDYILIGRLSSFYKEYHNEIKSEKGFNEKWIRYYIGECREEGGRKWISFTVNGETHTELAYTTLGVDLSASEREKSDYTVLLPLATIHDNRRFILPYSRGRYATYNDFDENNVLIRLGVIDEAKRLHNLYHFDKIIVDAVGNQLSTFNLFVKEFRSYSHPPQLIPYIASGEKFSRLKDLLQPEYQLGRIHHIQGMDELRRELVSFGATTDDILDALYDAIKYASTPGKLTYEKTMIPKAYADRMKARQKTTNWMVL